MADRDGIGGRVAALRKTRGWTARELARRARVSYSLLAKVETGSVPASPAFTGAVARALRVDVSRVTGQPYEEPGNATALQAGYETTEQQLHDAIVKAQELLPLVEIPSEMRWFIAEGVRAMSGASAAIGQPRSAPIHDDTQGNQIQRTAGDRVRRR